MRPKPFYIPLLFLLSFSALANNPRTTSEKDDFFGFKENIPPYVSTLLQSSLHSSNARAIMNYAAPQESMLNTLKAYAMAVGVGLPQDVQQAGSILQKEVSKGYVPAKHFFAQFALDGLIPAGNKKNDLPRMMVECARKDFVPSMVWLGSYFFEKNMSEPAFFWLDKAAENGSFAARYVRGGMYCEGLGCKKDIEKAEKDLQYVYSNCKMAKLASDAGFSLALLYKLEYNSPDYLRKAEVILKELAERGHPEAQYEYSCILCNKGDSNFIYWLDQAIQNGHEGAIKTAEDILNKYKAKESSNGKK